MDKSKDFKQVLLDLLRKNTSDIDGWFSSLNIEFNSVTSQLYVGFPHKFFADWFFETHKKNFEINVNKVCTLLNNKTPIFNYEKLQNEIEAKNKLYTNFLKLNQKQDFFHEFIYNNKNEFPFKLAKEIAENPFNSQYNPLVLYGKNYTGKSTLLKCIKSYVSYHHFQDNLIFYDEAENFLKLILEDVQKATNDFSFFIIDDLQDEFIVNNKKKFIEFINICVKTKKQIICAASQDYKNKLLWVDNLRLTANPLLVVQLKESDVDVRMRYIAMLCQKYNLYLKKEFILLLAQRCVNFSALQNILLKINAFSKFNEKPLDRKDIENILHSEIEEIKYLSPGVLVSFVANYFEMAEENILSNKKNPDIVHARYVTMYLCRDLLGMSYPAIGKFFGGKDHSTAIYAIKKIKKMIDTNKNMQLMVSDLRIKCLAL